MPCSFTKGKSDLARDSEIGRANTAVREGARLGSEMVSSSVPVGRAVTQSDGVGTANV